MGRAVFYNNSSFDRNDPAPGPADDGAIAADKSPLLPGDTATLANITNYSRGINGIMIDVLGLASTPVLADFSFKIGTSADPTTWVNAPAPTSIVVRPGVGRAGSDRITLIWPDNWIQNTWLQVTVKATSDTGLRTADVFYFGNLIGDSGDSPTDPQVDAVDVAATDNQPYTMSNLAPITAGADYDRDGLITASDGAIADRSSGDSLPLLAAPAAPASLPLARRAQPVQCGRCRHLRLLFAEPGDHQRRARVLAIAEIRSAPSIDTTAYGIAMRRSTDGGANWSPISMIYSIPPCGSNSIGVPSAVVDKTTGKVFVLFMLNDSDVMVSSSSDDGLTWTAPTDITSSVKVTASGNPNPAAYPDTPWGLYDVSSGHAIQLQNGPYAGRILVSANHGLEGDDVDSWSNVIYSDDHGQTWHLGGGLDQSNPQNSRTTENSMVELPDGSIYMSIRYYQSQAYKGFCSKHRWRNDLDERGCRPEPADRARSGQYATTRCQHAVAVGAPKARTARATR